jgi:hypothetical protein
MKTGRLSLPVATASLFLCVIPGRSQVLFQHVGAANPTTEGFTLYSFGSPQLAPVLSDLGVNAWSIGMLSSDGAQYGLNLTAGQQAALAGKDWQLTYTLRVVQAPTTPSYDISSAFFTGSEMFSLYFGAASNGDPVVQVRENSLSLSPVFVVTGAGATYNTYSLTYHAATDSADLWVNGTELYGGMSSARFDGTPSFDWSGYQHASDVKANWSLVSLAVVPEPSAASLAVWCLVVGICWRSLSNKVWRRASNGQRGRCRQQPV